MAKEIKKEHSIPNQIDLESFEARLRYGLGHDSIVEMVKLYNHKDTTISQKMKINEILLSYTHAKQKAATAGTGDTISVNIVMDGTDEAEQVKADIKTGMSLEKDAD